MLTRRDALKFAALAAATSTPLPLAASVSAAPAPAVMTVDDIMALYRRMFVLHAPVNRDDGTTTWANDDAIFTLDRARDEVVVSGLDGPEWMVGEGGRGAAADVVRRPPAADGRLRALVPDGGGRATAGTAGAGRADRGRP